MCSRPQRHYQQRSTARNCGPSVDHAEEWKTRTSPRAAGASRPVINRRYALTCRQSHDLIAPAVEERIGTDDQCADPLLNGRCECLIYADLSVGVQRMDLQSKGASDRLSVCQLRGGVIRFTSMPATVTLGTSSRSSPNCFAPNKPTNTLTPVKLPPDD